MQNTTKNQLIRDIEKDSKDMNVTAPNNLRELPTSQVEILAQAFKDAKK